MDADLLTCSGALILANHVRSPTRLNVSSPYDDDLLRPLGCKSIRFSLDDNDHEKEEENKIKKYISTNLLPSREHLVATQRDVIMMDVAGLFIGPYSYLYIRARDLIVPIATTKQPPSVMRIIFYVMIVRFVLCLMER